jgi:tetratricopeptide (TPR) repeat protein
MASVERAAAENGTPENRAALSVAQLIAGDVDAGIRGLETVTREKPDALFLSDLSAAYLLDGLRTANRTRFRQAVDVADRALQIDMLPEALFNKAFALERLGDTAAARAAWNAVREREPGSGWAAEADEHLRRLAAP